MCKYRLKRNYDEHLVVCWLTWNGWKRKSVEASFGVVSDLLWYNFCIHFFQNQMCSVTAIFWFHRGLGTSEICRARYIASGTINFLAEDRGTIVSWGFAHADPEWKLISTLMNRRPVYPYSPILLGEVWNYCLQKICFCCLLILATMIIA